MNVEADIEGFTDIAMGTQPGQRPAHNLYAEFYSEPVQDKEETLKQGRPIFKEVDYVKIIVPGDKNSIIQRPVRIGQTPRSDNIRFAEQYRNYKAGQEQQVEGTPLSEWPLISRAQVKELDHFGVKTVEQLAEMPDTAVQNHMGVGHLKNQAKAYMESARGNSATSELQSELDTQRREAESMRQQMAEMSQEMKSLKEANHGVRNQETQETQTSLSPGDKGGVAEEEGKAKRGPGRPPKKR